MDQNLSEYLKSKEKDLQESVDHFSKELTRIRAGKANVSMLQGIMVDYYGSATPLNGVATVGLSDARTLTVQPWEKSMLDPIERAIFEANLGLTPQNDGEIIRISVPVLTEERRKELVKQAKAYAEDAKVALRSTRHKMMDAIKAEVKDGYPEDEGKRKEQEVDKKVQSYMEKIDLLLEAKEKDIMTV